MPDVELLKFPSRESGAKLQDQGDSSVVYPSRRRSCALVNTPAPCVNKALCHIQELKRKLDSWGQQISPGRSASASLWREMARVLVEVLYLTERLETDRRETEETLCEEKKKARKLRQKIDSLSLWKQQVFPVTVQNEHEACSRDICELKWHLKKRKDQLQQVKDRLIQTEVLNQRLNEDIDFVKREGCLVKGKLQLESEIMEQIQSSQDEANETLTKTLSKLKSLQQELKKEELSASKRTEKMNMELKGIGLQLKKQLNELQQSQSNGEAYFSKVNETKEQITIKENMSKSMFQEIVLAESKEAEVTDSIDGLKPKIVDKGREVKNKNEDFADLQKRVRATRCVGEERVFRFEELFRQKRKESVALHDQNKEHELETEDLKKKIQQSVKKVEDLQKERKQMLLKLSQNERQRDGARAELTQVSGLHSHTKGRLEDLEQQTFMEEQRMRRVKENLKKEIMAEMKAVAILKGKIDIMTTDFNRQKAIVEEAESKLQKEFEGASSVTAQMETEIAKLQQIYTEKSEKIENLKAKLNDILSAHKAISAELERKKNSSTEHLNAMKESHNIVSTRLQNTLSNIEELRVKYTVCRQESDEMEKMGTTMPDIIDGLQSVSDAVEFEHKTASVIINSLMNDISHCKSRTAQCEETHITLLSQRQDALQEIKTILQTTLQENVALAREYSELQRSLMVAKREAVCVFEQRNRANASLHDHKELSLLQKRMHKAMVKYFRRRSACCQAELAQVQALSNENSHKMRALQEELSETIRRISAFLWPLTDDSTSASQAAANKQSGGNAGTWGRRTAVDQTAE
ncbi:coiled-coil domain-containing protein 178 [Chanos chanos]|uniref:Coiled-coil domain-containing protein 178 n=1 Tax=Chanos chanos TaxID=29144 RepID=A0A6J2UTX4_CHACN|nr:coiled-coil domain-containing protein 178 [Chanos chanos]